jgi:hypothetical protein
MSLPIAAVIVAPAMAMALTIEDVEADAGIIIIVVPTVPRLVIVAVAIVIIRVAIGVVAVAGRVAVIICGAAAEPGRGGEEKQGGTKTWDGHGDSPEDPDDAGKPSAWRAERRVNCYAPETIAWSDSRSDGSSDESEIAATQ